MNLLSIRSGVLLAAGLLIAGALPAEAQNRSTSVPLELSLDAGDVTRPASAIEAAERALTPEPVAAAPATVARLPRQVFGDPNDEGAGVGVLGMVTRTSWRADGIEDLVDTRTGWGAGLWFGGNKNGPIGATGELIYTVRKVDQLGLELETKSLEIPLLLRINIGSRRSAGLTVYGVGGPVITWHISQTLDGDDVGDAYRNGDLGLMLGAGLEVFHIGVEGRGNWGYRTVSIDGDFNEAKTYQFELVGKIRFN